MDSGRLESDARVLISLVAPTSDQSCRLRLWHSGSEDAPLEGTLGPATIQLDPSSNSSLTIDEMTLHPVQDPGSSESYYPGIRLSQGSGMTLSSNLEEQGRFRSGDTVIFYMTFSCLMDLGGTVWEIIVGHIRLRYPYCPLIRISRIVDVDDWAWHTHSRSSMSPSAPYMTLRRSCRVEISSASSYSSWTYRRILLLLTWVSFLTRILFPTFITTLSAYSIILPFPSSSGLRLFGLIAGFRVSSGEPCL